MTRDLNPNFAKQAWQKEAKIKMGGGEGGEEMGDYSPNDEACLDGKGVADADGWRGAA